MATHVISASGAFMTRFACPAAGAYLCIRAYGQSAASFALRATLDRCPSSFAEDGTPIMCGTRRDTPEADRRYSECTAAGECVCTGEYAKPVPEVYPGKAGKEGGGQGIRATPGPPFAGQ